MKKRKFSAMGIAMWWFFVFVHYSPAHAYRPFITEDAGVAGKGVVELEVSWDYVRWDNGDEENNFLLVPVYGITERIELSVEVPYMFLDPEEEGSEDGPGDVSIAGKFLLIEEGEWNPAFKIKAVLKTQSGDEKKGLGSGDPDYTNVAVVSKTIGDFQLHGMLGYTFVGNDNDETLSDFYLYGIGIDYGLTENFHLVAEVAGNRNPDRTFDDDPSGGLIGAIYGISEQLTIDCGARFGFNDASPDWSITVGMSITF